MRLIDADALKLKLDSYADRDCEYPIDYCDVKLEIKNAPTVMQWVSVEEGLPKNNVDIVFLVSGIPYAGYRDCHGNFEPYELNEYESPYSSTVKPTEVTHWMPLPPPPGKQQT